MTPLPAARRHLLAHRLQHTATTFCRHFCSACFRYAPPPACTTFHTTAPHTHLYCCNSAAFLVTAVCVAACTARIHIRSYQFVCSSFVMPFLCAISFYYDSRIIFWFCPVIPTSDSGFTVMPTLPVVCCCRAILPVHAVTTAIYHLFPWSVRTYIYAPYVTVLYRSGRYNVDSRCRLRPVV